MFGAKSMAEIKKPVEEGTKALVQINENFGRIQRNFEEVEKRLGSMESARAEVAMLREELKAHSLQLGEVLQCLKK